MQIFWKNDGPFKEKYSLRIPVASGRTQYPIQIPWMGRDMVLRIDMGDACPNVELYSVKFSLPAHKPLELDLMTVLNPEGKSANMTAPRRILGGGVVFSTQNDPWFIPEFEMKLDGVPLQIIVAIPLVFFVFMWLIFHPDLLKGNRNGGYLLLETTESTLELIESLQGAFDKLELIRSVVSSGRQSYHFRFHGLQDFKTSDVFSTLMDCSEVISIRIQLNRSGEV